MALTPDAAAKAGLPQEVQNKIRLEELRKNLTPRESEEKRLRSACQGFEAVFLNKMLTQMRASVPKGGMLHSQYEDQYQSMFDQQLAEQMAKDGGIGLGQMLYDQVSSKLHPKPNRGVTGDVGDNHAISRFPVAKTEQYRGDTVQKDGMRSLPGATKIAGYTPSRVDVGPVPGANLAGAAKDAAMVPAVPGMAMAAPSDGEISSDFGWRTDPFTGKRAWHSGVDIKAPQGTPVAACWDGKVVFAGEKGGLGKCLVVEHPGGWQSVYGHTSKTVVREGDTVRAGQKIAEIGDTGRSTGSHLHFELRRDGTAYDPVQVQTAALASRENNGKAAAKTQVAAL